MSIQQFFQDALTWFKTVEKIVRVSYILNPGETPSFLGVSSGSNMFAYGTMVAICMPKIKSQSNPVVRLFVKVVSTLVT